MVPRGFIAAVVAGMLTVAALGDDDVTDLTGGAKVATTKPVEVVAPDAQPDHAPARARGGAVTLNDGTVLRGEVWTTLETPLRVWVEETKSYRDVRLEEVKRVEVHVVTEAMEDDWRWLKEGSDKKVFSGRKYPNVELTYKFTLGNDQVVEGGVVGPIYVLTEGKVRSLALYKKYKGKLDETLKDLVYVRSIEFTENGGAAVVKGTRKLPLVY